MSYNRTTLQKVLYRIPSERLLGCCSCFLLSSPSVSGSCKLRVDVARRGELPQKSSRFASWFKLDMMKPGYRTIKPLARSFAGVLSRSTSRARSCSEPLLPKLCSAQRHPFSGIQGRAMKRRPLGRKVRLLSSVFIRWSVATPCKQFVSHPNSPEMQRCSSAFLREDW